MGALERLDKVLEEFEESAGEIGKIKSLIDQTSMTADAVSRNTEVLVECTTRLAEGADKIFENEKKLEEYLVKDNVEREEFLSSVKSTLVKMNNENMDLYQNLSASTKGNIEAAKLELVNKIANSTSDIKTEVVKVNETINQLNSDLMARMENIEIEILDCKKNIEVKFKYLNILMFIVLGGISLACVLITMLLV